MSPERLLLSVALMLLLAEPAARAAPGPGNGDHEPVSPSEPLELSELAREIGEQRAATAALEKALDAQQAMLDEQRLQIASQRREIEQLELLLQSTSAQVSQLEETSDSRLQDGDVLLSERLDRLEQQLQEAPEDPMVAQQDFFPGSWRVPGTNSAMRIGGFVKMNIVQSFDPLITRDRFIVGSIPPSSVNIDGAERGTVLTAQQSRINLDLRDNTEFGMLRAFVEGDFAGENESFRLRHAFGQFDQLLAGKTWSTLMHLDVTPEEIDFEGINGRINVRQPQLRFFPEIGSQLNLRVALEDPNPDVTGGEGANTVFDAIVSLDWESGDDYQGPFNDWTLQTALIGRQLKGRVQDTGAVDSTGAWGLVTSGMIPFGEMPEGNRVVWQLTVGEGIGRYINDLGTIGGQDAIFSPDGKLEALPVFAGYLSYQHRWNPRWRSNATFSWVKVDTYDYQSSPEYVALYGDPYERTIRASANVIFSPVRRVELGAELLWGERRNANNTKGDATQLQFSARYFY